MTNLNKVDEALSAADSRDEFEETLIENGIGVTRTSPESAADVPWDQRETSYSLELPDGEEINVRLLDYAEFDEDGREIRSVVQDIYTGSQSTAYGT